MITPVIIQAVFWIGVAFILIASFALMFAGDDDAGVGPLAGIGLLLFGTLLWRVYCELLILFFRMNETLTDIRNNGRR
jgi:hypothetical protein